MFRKLLAYVMYISINEKNRLYIRRVGFDQYQLYIKYYIAYTSKNENDEIYNLVKARNYTWRELKEYVGRIFKAKIDWDDDY